MTKTVLLALAVLISAHNCLSQGSMSSIPGQAPLILGSCQVEDLTTPPYSEWFSREYGDSDPDSGIMDQLRPMITDGYRFRVFFGSWCGDSKHKVPHFLKLLDLLGAQEESRELIGVGNRDTVYKRSPAGWEEDLGIFRVPTFIILKNGEGINRITEFPVRSLERDIFSIVNEEGYSPNYKTYPFVLRWLEEGHLTDRNVSEKGLANQIRSLVMNRWELESCGLVLLRRGDPTAALTIFRMNRYLFPDDPRSYASLAEGLDATGDREASLTMIDRALGLSTDPDQQECFRQLKDRIEW